MKSREPVKTLIAITCPSLRISSVYIFGAVGAFGAFGAAGAPGIPIPGATESVVPHLVHTVASSSLAVPHFEHRFSVIDAGLKHIFFHPFVRRLIVSFRKTLAPVVQ